VEKRHLKAEINDSPFQCINWDTNVPPPKLARRSAPIYHLISVAMSSSQRVAPTAFDQVDELVDEFYAGDIIGGE
jgi:hypothetical protein